VVNKSKLEYEIYTVEPLKLYNKIKLHLDKLVKVNLVYKKNNEEYITEKISLEWLAWVDSHSFFVWLELKKTQKHKYNIQNYDVVMQLHLDAHTNR
jgi:hypothetical protein